MESAAVPLGISVESEGIPEPRPIPSRRYVGTPLPQRGTRSFRGLDEDGRKLASEAYHLWRDLAAVRGNPYGDHTGCLLAGRMAVAATRWEDGLVVLEAIRQRMDGKSSPRWIPEWSRELGADRRTADRVIARRSERDQADNMDPEVKRVMIGLSLARAQGRAASLDAVTCSVCRQFTETKCPMCHCALHVRSCPSRHECVA